MRVKRLSAFTFFFTITYLAYGQVKPISIYSPDKKIHAKVWSNADGQPFYSIERNKEAVLMPSRLGVVRNDEDFSSSLVFTNESRTANITDDYQLFTGKKSNIKYNANTKTISYVNKSGQPFSILLYVSNDGVAFRYSFPGNTDSTLVVREELTSFRFPTTTKAWLQPMSVAKSGWERTNPAYEEHYKQDMPVGTPSPTAAGWVYPALFNDKQNWVLITEAQVDSMYCASRLRQESTGGEYRLGFPDAREVMDDGNLLPRFKLPYLSPWRVITVGGLNTIIESTLGTDLAKEAIPFDKSFIKPGKASWSWIMSKDDSIVYSEQKRYVDFASEMKWQYCLVDVNWDRKIGYERIKDLSLYAASKNVGLILWYNSSGPWNTTRYTPKSMLLTRASRLREFAGLKALGIKGLKIDFFAGDGQSVMKYYHDILIDAAKFGLLINFHGATLPRGWHRTYPHLVTAEAVRGFEMVTFSQDDANAEANHAAMLPFTRNAFDPMDFTPMNLYRIPTRVRRQTTSGFELALSVLFLSGIQHFAESPDGMQQVPDYVKTFLKYLPDSWDDVKFIDGYPGKYIVLARRAGNNWYVCGINADKQSRTISLPLQTFKKRKGTVITDGDAPLSFSLSELTNPGKYKINLKPAGGFVITLE